METASSSSYSTATSGVDDAMALEGGHAVRTKTLEAAAKHGPWYTQPRVLVLLSLVLIAGAGAGVAVAFFSGGGLGGGSSTTANDGGSGGYTDEPAVPSSPTVTVVTSPSPTVFPTESPTETPTAFPTTATPTETALTMPPTTAPPTERPSFSPSASPAPSTSMPTSDRAQDAFSFYVMGDIPYNLQQEYILVSQIEQLNTARAPDSVFVVHVGDMMSPARSRCQAQYYESVADVLVRGPLPTLVLAGDNDWLDCNDPTLAWQNFNNIFVNPPFEQYWFNSTTKSAPFPFQVSRNFPYQDMFSFVHEGVLFLSVSVWAGDIRFEQANVAWVTDRIEKHFAEEPIRGVVVFGHGVRTHDNRGTFVGIMANFFNTATRVYRRHVPVLYIHGDGHMWNIDYRFSANENWDMYRDIQVDQGMAAPPILVEVAPSLDGDIFVPLTQQTPWQHVFGNGLFRIDRQGGRYDGSG